MQDLTHLYLKDALASAAGFLSSAAFQTFQKINLPRLSRLQITAPLSTATALLSCVNIPLETRVRLHCDFEHGSSLDDYAPHSSLLAQRLSAFEDQAPSALTILFLGIATLPQSTTLTFSSAERECSDDSHSTSCMNWCHSIPLQIAIRFGQSITLNDKDRVISDICCSVPLIDVHRVHAIRPPFSSALWRKILGHLQDLRYLKLSEGGMPDLASILSLPSHGYPENEGIFAPALEQLELYKIQFTPKPPPGRDMDTLATDVQSLYDALSSRKESQGQLTMTRCVAKYDDHEEELDMVGRWEGGHFHVVDDDRHVHE
ncbi:hypothetical protein OG21DRAFT_1480767 [Imleria badia]|nr:hypothetical protein OG21DRAFT_1480767 [Imleria badia]